MLQPSVVHGSITFLEHATDGNICRSRKVLLQIKKCGIEREFRYKKIGRIHL